MERIFLVRLSKVEIDDIRKIFNIILFRAPDHIENYYAKPLFSADDPYGIWYEDTDFEVHDANHNVLGVFRIRDLSIGVTISFYITDTQHRLAFIEYIKSTIQGMRLVGFTILQTEGFNEDIIDLVNDSKPYLPSTKETLEKWKKAYKIICDMKKEELDDPEGYKNKIVDFGTRINFDLKTNYSERTIRRIKKAGDEGLLS